MADDAGAVGALPAGDFAAWLSVLEEAVDGRGDSDVPCGGCTACCRSSQFINIAPEETDTLAHIPRALRFPAPGRPVGHVLLGYDEDGACPMLIDDRCSIYDHRPRSCRVYDCRVIPAAGVELDEPTKGAVAERARRWRFSYADDADRHRHGAVEAAAGFLLAHPEVLPDDLAHLPPTQLAVLAIEVHRVFLRVDDETNQLVAARPSSAIVRATVEARTGRREVTDSSRPRLGHQ